MRKKIISMMLALTMAASLFIGAIPASASGSSATSYYTFKISDDGGTTTVKKKNTWQYYQSFLFDSGSNGLVFHKGTVNILFLANLYKGSSMKWLNDEHTKVQFIINGKKLVFTDGSYYYTSNGKKKSLSSIPYASKKPTTDKYGDPTNKKYIKVWEATWKTSATETLFEQMLIKEKVHDKFLNIKYKPFSTKYFNVPESFLLQEGFYTETTNEGTYPDWETIISIPKEDYNTKLGKLTFTTSNKINTKNLLTLKFASQFNSLPADIREIAVKNYKKKFSGTWGGTYEYDSPFQTWFKGNSWTTRAKVESVGKSGYNYYGDKTTYHGIDVSFVMAPEARKNIFSDFEKMGLPKDFAQHLYDTVLAYNDYYELNQKMTFSFTSSDGNTYKYVLGRIKGVTAGRSSDVISILVPNHPAMVGEHFMGGYYKEPTSVLGFGIPGKYDKQVGYREDFNLGYELPNNARVKFGMDEIEGNVKTWKQWRDAYQNDRSKLIPTTKIKTK